MVRAPIIQKVDFSKRRDSSCKNSFVITDFETGEAICQNCGIVIQNADLQDGSGRDLLKNFDYASHGGNSSSLRLHDMGLATIIGRTNQDSSGRSLDFHMRQTLNRMRLWDSRSQAKNSSEHNLRYALLEMEKLKEKLSLSDAVMERSAYLYRKAAKAQLIRGRSIKGVLVACVYIACREMDATRTIMDISKSLQENKNSIARNYRILFQNLKLVVSVPDFTKSFEGKLIKDNKIQKLQEIVNRGQVELKIAIPNSEQIVDTFSERIGIFRDEEDQTVAFTGTSKESFSAQSRDFESVDVFTSWNDKSRVERKVKDFEELWENKAKHVEVYDFMYAEENNLLKYSSEWIMKN